MVTDEKRKDVQWGLGRVAFSLLPLSPESVGRRKTLLTEVVPGRVWTLDQLQGIINVNVPVRATVIKLKEGGLFVHNPIAPTGEAVTFMRTLEEKHGRVKYIVLASTALEHKGTAGAFANKFPQSKVYVQPGQYSFPVDLPSALFFPPGKRIEVIPKDFRDAPWGDEIEHDILPPIKPPGPGTFSETAFFHKATKTLLVTDTIVKVTDEPPAIIQEDPRALLYHARDDRTVEVQDTPEMRRSGWRRMVLFGLTFFPASIDVSSVGEVVRTLDTVPDSMATLGEGALPFSPKIYAWRWARDERPNFKALQRGLLVPPILQELILNREPESVLAWADRVSKWPFTRIVPCHLSNDIRAGPAEFRRAFAFLEPLSPAHARTATAVSAASMEIPNPLARLLTTKRSVTSDPSWSTPSMATPEDSRLLRTASDILTRLRIVYPAAKPVLN